MSDLGPTRHPDNSAISQRRKALDITQAELARACGISRQFLSMMESGRVQPNVQTALKMAAALGSSVEELFATEEDGNVELEVTSSRENLPAGTRVNVALISGRWVAHPADTPETISGGFCPADGVLVRAGARHVVASQQPLRELEGNLIIAGCDPALHLLCNAKLDAPGHSIWVNCGSGISLQHLREGLVHVAGLHYGFDGEDENLRMVKSTIPDEDIFIMRFSSWEQGWLLSPRVPKSFLGVADIANNKLRIANREHGAAVRRWLDEELVAHGIEPSSIAGYQSCHLSHTEAVDSIMADRADLMLGPCVIASVFGLRFIPIGRVAFDLAFRRTLFEHPRMDASIKWLASKRFHQELSTLPGYHVT